MLNDFPVPAQIKYRGKIVRHDDREWDQFAREGKLLPTLDNIKLVLDRNETLTSYDVEIIVKYQVNDFDFNANIVDKFASDNAPTVSRLTMLLRLAFQDLLTYFFIAENKRADVLRDEIKMKWIEKGLRHGLQSEAKGKESTEMTKTQQALQRMQRTPLPDILSWKYLKLEDFYRIEDEKQRKLIIQQFDKADADHAKLTGFDRTSFLDERDFILSQDNPEIKEKLANGIELIQSEQETLDKINSDLDAKYHNPDKGKINKNVEKKAEKFATNMLKRLSQYSVRTVPRTSARGGGGTSSRTS